MNTATIDHDKASKSHKALQLRREIATLRIKRGDFEKIGEVPIGGSTLVFGGRNFAGEWNAKVWCAAWYAGDPIRVIDMIEFTGIEAMDDSENHDHPTDDECEKADDRIREEIKDFIEATIDFEIEDAVRTAKRYAERVDPDTWWDDMAKPALPSPARVA